jgi:hypothetical protein
MDDANRRRWRRWLAVLVEARSVEAAATRLLAELEDRIWLADFARAFRRSRAQLRTRWRWN